MRDWGTRAIRQLVRWLNPRAGKLKRMFYSDWLSERTDSQSDSGYKRLLPRFVWVLSVYVLQSECLSSTSGLSSLGPSCQFHISRVGPACKNLLFDHLVNPSFTQLAPSRWLDIGLVLFYVLIDLDFVKHQPS